MKFYINNKEIKTVIKNASIEGSLNSVSRTASFSYIYNSGDLEFQNYKARIGSSVLIKNDKNENIFRGRITNISTDAASKLINIQAQDLLSLLLELKLTGRFKGDIIAVIKQAVSGFNFLLNLMDFLSKEIINVVSFGKLTAYDIISIALKKLYGEEFKLYLDGNLKIHILFPFSLSRGDFFLGFNIISSSFSTALSGGNRISIKAIGDDKIVSGSVIRVIDPVLGVNGDFIVEKDKHTYTDIYTMDLDLKERKLITNEKLGI